jgi:hypothetical protein
LAHLGYRTDILIRSISFLFSVRRFAVHWTSCARNSDKHIHIVRGIGLCLFKFCTLVRKVTLLLAVEACHM